MTCQPISGPDDFFDDREELWAERHRLKRVIARAHTLLTLDRHAQAQEMLEKAMEKPE